MSAVIDVSGNVTVVRVSPPKIERATQADFGDLPGAAKLARITNAQTDAILAAYPQLPVGYTDFEVELTGTGVSHQTLRLRHGYGGRVRWWLVESSAPFPSLTLDATNTTDDVLVFSVASTASATIRVAPRGA